MDTERTSPTSFRLARDAKELLTRAAEGERRTLTGMLEVMIIEWCRNRGVTLEEEEERPRNSLAESLHQR